MGITRKDLGEWVVGDLTVADDMSIGGDISLTGGITILGDFIIGESGDGSDLKAWGDTAAYYMLWDANADTNGGLIVIGTTSLTGNLTVDGTLVSIDGSTSVRGISAGFTSLESPANRFGSDAAVYMSIATTATTGITAITHTGTGPTVTWTADSFDLVGATTLSKASAIGLNISGACTTHAISISAAQTGSGLHIGDTWKLGFSDAAINIGGDATIAFGSVAGHVTVQRTDVSAQMGAIDQYVMGHYRNLTTSGAGPGTALQHGIWIGDYTGLTIAHDTTDAYAVRGRTALTGVLEGNQFIGVMGQFEVTEAATLEATGGGYAVYGSITSSGSGTCNRNVAAGYFTMRTNTIDLAGTQSCVVADMGGSGYADYGVLAHVGNNNTLAAMRIETTDSAVLPIGLQITAVTGSVTKQIEFTSGVGIYTGSADPNGSLSAEDGSLYLRTGTTTATSIIYVCTGTTNWSATTV